MQDDPSRPRDATILRPRPGAARRPAGTDNASVAGHADAPGHAAAMSASPAATPQVAAPIAPQGGGAQAVLKDFLAAGRNPLLAAAAPLLVLGSKLSSSVMQADVES